MVLPVIKQILVAAFVITISLVNSVAEPGAAQKRAKTLDLGMNVSFLENYWLGTKEKNFADFVKPAEAAKRKKMFADIAKAGFKTVRIPICFSAWMEMDRPYDWTNKGALDTADSFIEWGLANGLNVIIDLHHPELDRSNPKAEAPERIVNLWFRIARRYKDTDPEKVFFELRNEPHKITAEEWRWQAKEIIKVVRPIAPRHTLIVGFHDWNSRSAMTSSKPFEDDNIIYTFHYYDPFLFTHQAASWVGNGFEKLQTVRFPYSKESRIKIPKAGQGGWLEQLVRSYKRDSDEARMYQDLKAAKDWSKKNGVPIFLGEFGSYSKNPSIEDRCRHAAVIYKALGRLDIPNAWWEWDGGFSMFEKGTTKIASCMKEAIDHYRNRKTDEE